MTRRTESNRERKSKQGREGKKEIEEQRVGVEGDGYRTRKIGVEDDGYRTRKIERNRNRNQEGSQLKERRPRLIFIKFLVR